MMDLFYVYKTVSKNKNSFVSSGAQMCYRSARIMTIRKEYRDLWKKAAIDRDQEAIKEMNNTEKFPYDNFDDLNDLIGYPCYMSARSLDAGYVRTNLVKDVYMVKEGEDIPKKWIIDPEITHTYNYKEKIVLTPQPGDFFIETESGSQYTLFKKRDK